MDKYFVVHDMSPQDESSQNVYQIGIALQENVKNSDWAPPAPEPEPPGPGPDPTPTPPEDSGIGTVEILIGVLVLLAVILTVCFLYRRNKQRTETFASPDARINP